MKLTYQVNDKPKFGQVLVFALQQLLAILAATIAVPAIIGNGMSSSAALFGAGADRCLQLLQAAFQCHSDIWDLSLVPHLPDLYM